MSPLDHEVFIEAHEDRDSFSFGHLVHLWSAQWEFRRGGRDVRPCRPVVSPF